MIRTTAEHPFFAHEKGWVACNRLVGGDWILGEDGQWLVVEDLLDTGEWDTVYNLRVADFHTYFVGSDEWGFSVWAHNAEYVYQLVNASGKVVYIGIAVGRSRLLGRVGEHARTISKADKFVKMQVISKYVAKTRAWEHHYARSAEATLIYNRLATALATGKIKPGMSIGEQLKAAGLLNLNRGRVKANWKPIPGKLPSHNRPLATLIPGPPNKLPPGF